MLFRSTTVTVGSRDYALFNVAGEFYCIDSECPHHGGPLGEGELEEDVVMCPWHAWQINVKTGALLYSSTFCVGTHKTKVEEDSIWIDV